VTPEQLARTYLDALGHADLAAMLALFTEDGQVHSPLYGPKPATSFFPELFGATTESDLTLQGVAQGTAESGVPLVTLWFRYGWLMVSGARTTFDVVDVLELAPDGRIATLRIIYDTVLARPLLEQQTGQPSWRPGSNDLAIEQPG
jgi:ketosteroid isomerase-like protein